ncbi:5-aminolevulinate synthase isoform X2 [Rhynchophorus ferrugineus]|uniref:5-aminolevulinate synthase isoform X2 n=1 Tax=Rhynchophorus ferrugineus TaxID=354439 RepID=UPI003FCD9BB1
MSSVFMLTSSKGFVASIPVRYNSKGFRALLNNYKMSCPFLTRLSHSYVKNYAPLLLNMYGSQCPVISRSINHMSTDNQKTQENITDHIETAVSKCPFLKEVTSAVKELKGQDIIEVNYDSKTNEVFPYNNFFHQQIIKKKKEHSYRIFKKVNRLAGPGEFPKALEYTSGEKPITVWCSNDYLGMSCHPLVKNEVRNALERYGSGAGGTRNISGNSTLHEDLEKTLAQLHEKDGALLFTSCFVANDTTLFTLAKALPGCHIFSDAGNHASMIQGIKNSQVPKHIFKHNDPEHLEELLKKIDVNVPKIVAFETVHSMTGAVCPLEELCDIAHKYGALTFVDEVHAVGLYGEHGAGIGERDHVMHKMDMISGTLGKAFGNIGGYVAGNGVLIDMIRSYGAGFIFTTSLPPTVLAGAKKAIEILASDEGRTLRQKHQENVQYLRAQLLKNGLPVEHTPSHIIPIKIGDPMQCTAVSDALIRDKGHYIQAINFPTVARGQEKLRLAPTPHHTKEMMDQLVTDLKQVWQDLNLPLNGLQCEKECKFCQKPILFKYYELRDRCTIPNCPQILGMA